MQRKSKRVSKEICIAWSKLLFCTADFWLNCVHKHWYPKVLDKQTQSSQCKVHFSATMNFLYSLERAVSFAFHYSLLAPIKIKWHHNSLIAHIFKNFAQVSNFQRILCFVSHLGSSLHSHIASLIIVLQKPAFLITNTINKVAFYQMYFSCNMGLERGGGG